MRILVTGHRGYIGTVLTPMLGAAGHDVTGLDIDLYRACSFPRDASLPPVKTISKDIRDLEVGDLAGFDAIIHLAGLSNDPLGEIDPNLTFAINHHATVRLAECARQAGVRRFLFASSCSNYGVAGDELVSEDWSLRPITAYGRSKVAAERDIARLAAAGMTVLSLRCATAFGDSPRLRFDLVLNNLVAWACATGQIYLKSDGSAWRPLVHVKDIAQVFAAFLDAPAAAFAVGTCNVGSDGGNVRIRDLADVVATAVPNSAITFAPGAEPDKRSYRVDFARLRRALPHFKPQWTVNAGAQSVAQLLIRMPIGTDEFEGVMYQRRAHLLARIKAGELDDELRSARGAPMKAKIVAS
ncbi:MAG: NAD(P)-dependent oxidoreductase [Xanthobacteraceae bacterium]